MDSGAFSTPRPASPKASLAPANKMSATSGSTQPSLATEETYGYMIDKKVPSLLDGICARLAEERPEDPVAFLVGHLNAELAGGFRGGVAVAGTSVGGGWLRTFKADGTMTGVVDRLPLFSEGELSLLVACQHTRSILIAGPAATTTGGNPSNTATAVNTVVRRFSWTCELLATYPISKPISCIGLEREKGHLWVLYKGGGGCVIEVSSGSILREVSLPPAMGAFLVQEESDGLTVSYIWLLSTKSIEKRDVETLQLEATIHLPDSMLKPTTFALSQQHIWCASASGDGSSANYCSAFERATGKVASALIAPTGSVVAYDPMRGGTWHMPLTSPSTSVTFINASGTKLMSVALRSWKKANLAIDRASGHLWMYSAEEGFGTGGCKVVCYDPLRCTTVASQEVPEVVGNTTLMVPL